MTEINAQTYDDTVFVLEQVLGYRKVHGNEWRKGDSYAYINTHETVHLTHQNLEIYKIEIYEGRKQMSEFVELKEENKTETLTPETPSPTVEEPKTEVTISM